MPDKKFDWVRIADTPDQLAFGSNQIAIADADGKKICIGKYNDELFAFAYKCPHAGGLLADGFIDPLGNIVCPLHRYKFSMKNGRNTSGEGFYLRHWAVEVRSDGVFVALDVATGLFGWLKG